MIETKADLKQAILEQLSKGRKAAISKNLLRQRLGLNNDRPMRIAIKDLRHEGYRIGLSLTKPTGYFLIETLEELSDCMNTLRGYCVEAAITRRDLKLGGRELLQPGQLKLSL